LVGERTDLVVISLLWDFAADGNVAHLARHGLQPENINAVLMNQPIFFRNVPGRRASHVMIGRDDRDRSLYVTLLAAGRPGYWAPVTGWRSALAHEILQREGLI